MNLVGAGRVVGSAAMRAAIAVTSDCSYAAVNGFRLNASRKTNAVTRPFPKTMVSRLAGEEILLSLPFTRFVVMKRSLMR